METKYGNMWGGWCTGVVRGSYGVNYGNLTKRNEIASRLSYPTWWVMGNL